MLDQFLELGLPQGFQFHDPYPMGSGHVGSRNDPFDFCQLGKLLGRAFEREFDAGRRLEAGDAEHLSRYAEQKIVSPLDIFGRMGQR